MPDFCANVSKKVHTLKVVAIFVCYLTFKLMKIAVAGTGYVGLSMATLLSQRHEVVAVDILPEKVEMINRRKSPIQDEYIEKYFAGIFSCAEIGKGKDQPDVFLLAAERLGVKPETCFVFEDSPLGIIAANKAGMKAIGVPDVAYFSEESKAECFAVLSSLKEHNIN